jgi:hypothetical protein
MGKEANIPGRQMLGASLTMSVVLVLGAGKAAPAEPPRGCAVYGPIFGMERLLMCGTFRVEVYPPMPAAAEKTVITDLARTASVGEDRREVMSMTEMKIGPKMRVTVRYLRKRRDGNSDVGLVTTLPGPPGTVRMLHCWNAIEAGCQEVFSALSKGLPDVTGALPGAPPRFGSKAIEPGPGCTAKGPGHISCAQGELTWAPLFGGAAETIGEVEPLVTRAWSQVGAFEAKDKYCELGGVDALCRLATITPKKGPKTWLIYGFGSAQGERVWTLCSTRKEPKDAPPAHCSQLVGFKK